MPGSRGRFVALTGTPGTGKSSVARHLPEYRPVEVGDLARAVGAARPRGRSTEVDLAGLSRWVRSHPPPTGTTLVVGHLAHLLPVRESVVLRCAPLELLGRLRRARRGAPAERTENLLAEAIDVVLAEAVAADQRVREIDTTGRSPEEVARLVRAWLRGPRRARYGSVDWLSDPSVTDSLFRLAR